MKISVVVPVYNCAPYVERCIRSILAQTYPKLEIICVNDGSSDGSGKILDYLALEDSRIQVIHQENRGVSAARNAGIQRATGDLVTFVDSDDAIEPDMYEMLLPLFSDEQVDIVHCGYKRISPDGTVKDVNGTGRIVTQNRYEAAQCLLQGKLFVGSLCNKLYKKKLFADIALDTAIAINEDVLMNAELFKKAKSSIFYDIGKYLVYERIGSASSVTTAYKKATDCVVAAEKMLALFTGTAAEAAAEERLLYSQIGLYRWYVMHGSQDMVEKRKQLDDDIDRLLQKRTDLTKRQRMNYVLMRYFPVLYRYAYRIYDKIRVPNWDVAQN